MDYHYETNCSQYVLMDGKRCLYGPYDQISLCFDRECGTLHKHGEPGMVAAWHEKTTKSFKAFGFNEMSDNLICVTGRFPLEEINKCLTNSGYAEIFYKKLMAGEIAELPFTYG